LNIEGFIINFFFFKSGMACGPALIRDESNFSTCVENVGWSGRSTLYGTNASRT